jgi:hypothetical protein
VQGDETASLAVRLHKLALYLSVQQTAVLKKQVRAEPPTDGEMMKVFDRLCTGLQPAINEGLPDTLALMLRKGLKEVGWAGGGAEPEPEQEEEKEKDEAAERERENGTLRASWTVSGGTRPRAAARPRSRRHRRRGEEEDEGPARASPAMSMKGLSDKTQKSMTRTVSHTPKKAGGDMRNRLAPGRAVVSEQE